ncbi:MAG: hypothetical protein ABI580_09260 [Burkholderiaceae bacterium]
MAANDLRTELAATAARLIAEEGCEYAQAKRRAVQEILGEDARRSTMPDNQEVEHELRRYLKLFGGEPHRALLAEMRSVAAGTMQTLQEFDPYLIGAVLNGTATEHSDINLQLFVDSAKDVELRLMTLGVDFDVDDGDAEGDRPAALERLNFVLPPTASFATGRRRIGVRLHIYARDAIRIAARHRRDVSSEEDMHPIEGSGRANLDSVRRLIEEAH